MRGSAARRTLCLAFFVIGASLLSVPADAAAFGFLGAFAGPFGSGIAVDEGTGDVYVVDQGNGQVDKFRADGAPLAVWGSQGAAAGQFDQPVGVAVDGSGNVFVADQDNERIVKLTSSGTFVKTWGWGVQDGSPAFQVCRSGCRAGLTGHGDGQFDHPVGVAVDAAGNVYVSDTVNNRIEKFDSAARFLKTWGWGVKDGSPAFQTCVSGCRAGTQGSGNGQMYLPFGISEDGGGHLYVVDFTNHRIEKFGSGGGFLLSWGTQGSAPGEFNFPQAVAADQLGHVYVADPVNNRAQEFGANGNFVRVFGGLGSAPGQMMNPDGIAADCNGTAYVEDTGNGRVEKFGESGLSGPPCLASNHFTVKKVEHNRRRGTATLLIKVPGPGTLLIIGRGVIAQRPLAGAARIGDGARKVGKAGTVELVLRAKGKLKRKLNLTGHAKAHVVIAFTPTGGTKAKQARTVRLVKTR